jgi:hypothetical protein
MHRFYKSTLFHNAVMLSKLFSFALCNTSYLTSEYLIQKDSRVSSCYWGKKQSYLVELPWGDWNPGVRWKGLHFSNMHAMNSRTTNSSDFDLNKWGSQAWTGCSALHWEVQIC